MLFFLCLIALQSSCLAQQTSTKQDGDGGAYTTFPRAKEAFGNFSIELLYHTSIFQTDNFILTPFNAWSALAAVADGALASTRTELCRALRISINRTLTRSTCQGMTRDLNLNTTTVQLARFNAILIDKSRNLEVDFRAFSRLYDTFTIPVDLKNARVTASRANKAVAVATKGLVTEIVDENDFSEPQMLIISAAYFKGQWTAGFNASSTSKQPFFDSTGVQIGEVNMMYNRFTYPLVDIDDLKASIIELPFDSEGRLSLLIILPNEGVSLKEMLMNFQKVPLDVVYAGLRLDQEEHGEDIIECLVPRFRVDSNLELKETLKRLGIFRMFNDTAAALGHIARSNVYVTKIIHKTVIEVTEGTAEVVTAPESKVIARFEANRPFMYLVLAKTTNTVLLEGVYQQPQLY
ncbi:hypothetical protein MSG28_012651 [Choristoneura fumiferana]|uniref:Uncharacterized protein n=1 Tax=Choristoneura fumiferana TaxID=7141 RepID=A0ACC0JHH8_CHOFU|nr:hypothetical protein MSG28_012651 [Choristoneura fumiferana]